MTRMKRGRGLSTVAVLVGSTLAASIFSGCTGDGHAAHASSTDRETLARGPETRGTEGHDPGRAGKSRDLDELISAIVQRTYENRSDVATGRFLRRFHQMSGLLRRMDSSKLKTVSRSPSSIRVEAPCREGRRWDDDPAGGTIQVRLVPSSDGWKVESVRLIGSRNSQTTTARSEEAPDTHELYRMLQDAGSE